jgi:ABC-2 type transport system permease protein
MTRYIKVWIILSVSSFQSFFVSRFGAVLFLIGKIMRFAFYLGFLALLAGKTRLLSGYSLWEILFFYLTFNLIDAATQMLFRDVYRFRQLILNGNFDLILVKPVNALFRSLFGGPDFLDFITLFPFFIALVYTAYRIPTITTAGILAYLILMGNSFLIAVSFHVFVLALAILTTEIDHTIMIYRDFTGMGKIPIDIYGEPLRSFVTFVVPVGVMMTFPVKALLGLLSIPGIIIALIIGLSFFSASILFWKYALARYTSASS